MKPRSGFTLIELSIVLVIIGLLVGGVLVGRDMIHAAEIRKTVKQVEQFDAAINTFRNKYNCLPGDCTNPAEFGFTSYQTDTGVHGAPAAGNGDGMISDDDQPDFPYEIENAFWWLEQAGLIEGVNIGQLNAPNVYSYTVIPAVISTFQPYTYHGWSLDYATWNVLYVNLAADIEPGNEFFPQSGHYYLLTSDIYVANTGTITPADAFAIDAKMDDGLPRSGRVLATGNDSYDFTSPGEWSLPIFNGTTDVGAAGANSPYCVTTSPYLYNVQNTNPEAADPSGLAMGPWCSLGIKASF